MDMSAPGGGKTGSHQRRGKSTPVLHGFIASEMALCVLAYNLTRVMNIVGTEALLAAIKV